METKIRIPRNRIAVFTEKFLVGVYSYTFIPYVGQYIQLPGQKSLAYKVEEVIHLVPNNQKWEIAILTGNSFDRISVNTYYDALYKERDIELREKGRIYRDRKNFNEPDEKWQRRKALYERLEAGEKAEDIALELGVKPARVKHLASEWRHLKTRNYLHDQEEKEKDEQS
jgi:hypothetical protein